MASSKIYICDMCESYIDPKTLYRLTIGISPGPEYNSSTPAITISGVNTREICAMCAQKLNEDLSLDKLQSALNDEFRRNLSIPNALTQPIT